MAQAVVFAAIAAGKITAGTTAAFLATAAAAVVDLSITSSYQKKKAADARKDAASAPRDVTVRSAIEPARIIYGKARTSGPVVYTNTQPTPNTRDNSTLWTAISLANHECASIEEIWLDGDQILWSQLSGTGGVTSGKYGPIGINEVTNFYAKLGAPSQTALTQLVSAFDDWTSSYTGQDITYIVSAFELGTATGEGVWSQGAPQNIRAVVKGKKVYDPRKDSTQTGGSGSHRLADPTTWEWSDNPALCLADYLFDARLGMGAEGVTYNDIDWDMVAEAAQWCDAPVDTIYEMAPGSIPSGGSTKRFTCNGVLSTGATYADNIRALVSSMNGMLTWAGGKYRIRACAYEAPTYSFTEDDIIGDVQIQPERTRSQRFNTIRGTYLDPSSGYNSTEFIPVTNSTYQSVRDAGQKLTTDIALPMTNDEYMAQRLAYKTLNLNNQQLTAVIPLNWKALKVGVGDRIQVTVSELSWSNKIFVVEGWSFEPDKGFMLSVKEDSASAYVDPDLSDYSTRTLAGTVTFADQPIAAPSGLQATSEEEAILVEWEAPPRGSGYDEVVIYASADSSWANATEVGRTRSTFFRHELTRGTTRYYWVRSEDVDGRESIRDPDSDTSSITATAGEIDFANIGGDTKPEDNATNGSTLGTNTYDEDGTTVLGNNDLKNSINKGKTLALLLNKSSAGVSETGEGAFVGVDNTGLPALNTDGFFLWNGEQINVNRNQIGPYSFHTNLSGKKGFVVFDLSGNNFIVATTPTEIAFVWKESGQWYYDNNSSPVSFTPTDDMVALAYIETSSVTVDLIQRGGLLAEPVQLLALSEINADYISAGTISTDRLDVSGIINAGEIIVSGDNLSSLSNDSGFINGSEVNENVTSISGGVITTGTVLAARLDVTGIISAGGIIVGGDNVSSLQNDSGFIDGSEVNENVTSISGGAITTGTVSASRLDVSGIISAGGIVVGGDNVSSLTNDSGFINGGEVNDNVTSISGGVITTGTINASRINIDGVTLDTNASGQLTIAGGGVDTDQLAPGAVTFDKIQPGALVGKTIALLLNQNSNGTYNSGDGSLVGVNANGTVALNTDGFFIFNGVKYDVSRNQFSAVTFATQAVNKKGFLAYDISGANFAIEQGPSRAAFVWKEGNQWYYDNNSGSPAVAFTPSSSVLALGFINTSSPADANIQGGLLAEPVQLISFAEQSLDYLSVGTLSADRLFIDNVMFDTTPSGALIIADGGVSASQLAPNAATNLNSDTFTGNLAADWPNWKTSANGLPSKCIFVDVQSDVALLWGVRFLGQSSGASDIGIRIYQNSTLILNLGVGSAADNTGGAQLLATGGFYGGFKELVIPAGSYVFSMEWRSFAVPLYDAYLVILGLKR